MSKVSRAVNSRWKREAVAIATGRTGEVLYYLPSKRALLVTDGAGSIGLTVDSANELIKRDGMIQHAPVPTWDEMTRVCIELRRARRRSRA